jgi:uncharacterized protein YciI
MKKLSLLLLLVAVCGITHAQNSETPVYDSVLARSLGADYYGMKSYLLVILKTGEYNTTDQVERDSLFKGHFSNIDRLSEEGKLVLAGPFGKNDKQFRGLFILNTTSEDEAMDWLNNDPTIKSGLFDVDLIPWYGSAAISTHIDVHNKIQKHSIE